LRLTRLRLRHFRTYQRLDLHVAPGISVLYGANAAGKTNVVEAIFVLATTKSFRTRTDRELISWDIEDDTELRYARLEADTETRSGAVKLDMAIAEQPSRPGSEAGVRKQFKLNGVPKRASDVVGEVKAVLFAPDDVSLVTGSPSGRRRFMDVMLCQIDHHYLHALQEYGRVVAQRNSLLQRLRGRPDPATLIEFWDEKLIVLGAEIISTRKAMLDLLNGFASEAYTDISGTREQLTISYKPNPEEAAQPSDGQLLESFRRRVAQLQTKEIYQGVTLCGPHRDDLQFHINGADAQYFGSRGQQRSVALALRLAELHYMTDRTGEQPILLLDEALAELDDERRGLILRLMVEHPQVIATTSNLGALPEDFRERATLLRVEDGRIDVQSPTRAKAS
jgi:DNA replication and repair protein RecF